MFVCVGLCFLLYPCLNYRNESRVRQRERYPRVTDSVKEKLESRVNSKAFNIVFQVKTVVSTTLVLQRNTRNKRTFILQQESEGLDFIEIIVFT